MRAAVNVITVIECQKCIVVGRSVEKVSFDHKVEIKQVGRWKMVILNRCAIMRNEMTAKETEHETGREWVSKLIDQRSRAYFNDQDEIGNSLYVNAIDQSILFIRREDVVTRGLEQISINFIFGPPLVGYIYKIDSDLTLIVAAAISHFGKHKQFNVHVSVHHCI